MTDFYNKATLCDKTLEIAFLSLDIVLIILCCVADTDF